MKIFIEKIQTWCYKGLSTLYIKNLSGNKNIIKRKVCYFGFLNKYTPPRLLKISEKIGAQRPSHFYIPFMMQSHAESMEKILGAL